MNAYRTELDWDSGLTEVLCNTCQARAVAGALFTHQPGCPEICITRPRRRIIEITKIIHFKVACTFDENGVVVVP